MRIRKGFTLIELLVVIAIIGLLSTLAVVALNSARQKARDSKRVSDVKQIQTALELYFNDNDAYPLNPGAPAASEIGRDITCIDSTGWRASGCLATVYMGLAPRDPQSEVADDACAPAETAPCDYVYQRGTTNPNTEYNIHFRLEAATGGLQSGLNCGTEAGTGGTCTH